MFYVILARIMRRHLVFHLVIPLIVGILVEAIYANFWDAVAWHVLPFQLFSPHRIALYVGVATAYIVVVGVLIRSETNIGLRRIELHDLALKLRGSKSFFAIAPTPLSEWFDPALQAYFVTLFGERLRSKRPFRYERVLLLPSRASRKSLNSDYLDGYFAKCLIDIHRQMGIDLYFLEWSDIALVLKCLTRDEKVLIGYYPAFAQRLPEFVVNVLLLPLRRRRIRRTGCGIIERGNGTRFAFRFAKLENVIEVEMQSEAHGSAYFRFADLIKDVLYDSSRVVKPLHDFSKYYSA
jgi:hypothetical protein